MIFRPVKLEMYCLFHKQSKQTIKIHFIYLFSNLLHPKRKPYPFSQQSKVTTKRMKQTNKRIQTSKRQLVI